MGSTRLSKRLVSLAAVCALSAGRLCLAGIDDCRIALSAGFHDPCAWDTFDPGAAGLGSDLINYRGAVFAKGYVYFAPFNSNQIGCRVLRYDTDAPFDQLPSWSAFDPPGNAQQFTGGVFDGRFVYFSSVNAGFVRYDTNEPFDSPAAWQSFSPVDPALGYNGAGTFDGTYIYFAPWAASSGTSQPNGLVVRYDTRAPFDQASSWQTYDYGADPKGCDADTTIPLCANPGGFIGTVFDGRYVYSVPHQVGPNETGMEVLRYDTFGPFGSASSWTTYDYKADPAGCGRACDGAGGYSGAVYVHPFVYFVPSATQQLPPASAFHGHVLRLDTTGDFESAASWRVFDATTIDPLAAGFVGGVADGRYVYFVPEHCSRYEPCQGLVLRYDTQGAFDCASSWTVFDPGANGVGVDPDGYNWAAFDGRFFYCSPVGDEDGFHGEVLRFDTRIGGPNDCNCNGDVDGCECPNPVCACDINCDEAVDGGDLGVVLGFWGVTNPLLGDLDGDGDVDGGDLGQVLGCWGPCPASGGCKETKASRGGARAPWGFQ